MYSLLDNEWDLSDITQMNLRKIDFSQDAAQITATIFFRYAWIYEPPTPEDANFNAFSQIYRSNRDELWEKMPTTSERETLHTPLRDEVYHLFNHLFYDVSNFMTRMYDVGHLHPPNSDAFGLNFPVPQSQSQTEENKDACVFTKTWETEVLLVPAYLAPGVVVRVETCSEKVENGETVKDTPMSRGTFTKENPWQVWYLQKGLETRFYIEGEWEQEPKGLAAAMVYGKLCPENHCQGAHSDDDDDEDEDEDEKNEDEDTDDKNDNDGNDDGQDKDQGKNKDQNNDGGKKDQDNGQNGEKSG